MQISAAFAERVQDEFFAWADSFDELSEDSPYDSLQRYIASWLARDNCVLVTGGDYGNYLLAVLVIIHEYTKDPDRLNFGYIEGEERVRRVSKLIDLDCGSSVYLDRHVYMQEVMRRQLGIPD